MGIHQQQALKPKKSLYLRPTNLLPSDRYARAYDREPDLSNMDPDCAICSSPAVLQCDCEAKGLDTAVRQAEAKMMVDLRDWVRKHAQDYILEYFELSTARRKVAHKHHLKQIEDEAYYYHRGPPHPSAIHAANAELKRGIDADWRASVQKYPEVLEYYYSLVSLSLPRDDDPAVRDPPLSALTGAQMPVRASSRRETERRERGGTPGGRRAPPPGSGFGYGGRY